MSGETIHVSTFTPVAEVRTEGELVAQALQRLEDFAEVDGA